MSDSQHLSDLRGLSRSSKRDLAFWAVLVVLFAVALPRAILRGDGERTLYAGFFFLNACFWLVRTWWSRRNNDGQAAAPSPALAPPRLWIAGGTLLAAGSIALLIGPTWLGLTLLGVAAAFVLPLTLEDRRRRR